MADLTALSADLDAEQEALATVLSGLTEQQWFTDTPAPGWTVRHQVAHLAYFDIAAVIALTAPEEFAILRNQADTDQEAYGEAVLRPYLDLTGADLLQRWQDERIRLHEALATAPQSARVPWYGPSMSVASMVTARLMETWAHGQDVVDALGVRREPTARLAHVARLACLARPFSYTANGLPVCETPVRVELTLPDDSTWRFGDGEAKDVVRGPVEDFCLVLTRRRHVADTRLVADGEAAEEWLAIGQAYAGPAGAGRAPGQFDCGRCQTGDED